MASRRPPARSQFGWGPPLAAGRQRLHALQEWLAIQPAEWSESTFSRVLDCGIGAGVFSEGFIRALGAPARVYGADLSPRLLKRAAARLGRHGVQPHLLRADARALPIGDSQMDAVICGLVLDHLGEASAALGELARVARPGAPVVVVTTRPFAPDLPVRIVFRYRRLRPEAVERAMATAGLREVRRHSLIGLARPFGIAFTARAWTDRAARPIPETPRPGPSGFP